MRHPKDWGSPCPTPHCSHYRLINRGTIRALSIDLPQSGTRRSCRCGKCAGAFSETRDTVCFALRTPEEQGMMALKMRLVKVALSAMGFVLGGTEATVLAGLGSAAQQAHELTTHLLRALPVTEGPLDEMWRVISRKHTQPAAQTGHAPTRGRTGGSGGGAVSPQRCDASWRRVSGHGPWTVPCPSSRGRLPLSWVPPAVSALVAAVSCRLGSRSPIPCRPSAPGQARTPSATRAGPSGRCGLWAGEQTAVPRASARVGGLAGAVALSAWRTWGGRISRASDRHI